jgi:hypothetical protein
MSSVLQALAGIGAEDPQWAMQHQAQLTQAALKNGNYYNTQATGPIAGAVQNTAQALAGQRVTANWDAANQSAAQLSGIGAQMQQLGLGGGPLGAAATDAAQARVANAGGGLGGLRQVGAVGGQAAGMAAGVAQNESSAMLSAASQANANTSAAKLQQMVVDAALNHANKQNALGAQNVAFGVQNLQDRTQSALSIAHNTAQNQVTSLDTTSKHAQNQAALQWAQSILSGAASATGTAQSIFDGIGQNDGTSDTPATLDISPGTLSMDNSLSSLGDGLGQSLTQPTLGSSLGGNTGLDDTPTQLQLDDSLFNSPVNAFTSW